MIMDTKKDKKTSERDERAAASALAASPGSRPILRRDNAWTFEVENADGECVWANTGLGNGKRAPEYMLSKINPIAYFHRQEGSALIYRIPSKTPTTQN